MCRVGNPIDTIIKRKGWLHENEIWRRDDPPVTLEQTNGSDQESRWKEAIEKKEGWKVRFDSTTIRGGGSFRIKGKKEMVKIMYVNLKDSGFKE